MQIIISLFAHLLLVPTSAAILYVRYTESIPIVLLLAATTYGTHLQQTQTYSSMISFYIIITFV